MMDRKKAMSVPSARCRVTSMALSVVTPSAPKPTVSTKKRITTDCVRPSDSPPIVMSSHCRSWSLGRRIVRLL
ncbi:hypothetical protein CALCODRAFT_190189 [Calocera cornea HHB12733]|uniref:Uncharacterized protein n=1 Tax=Calocera cornea HHB12733 TaxID=1353952 RepID=A0A165C804_9BASI|nr:hypothetical protein CALCODRAFT_190189 [Calocera cornea HHB12733]